MKIRNKTMDRTNKIARSGTRIEFQKEAGDADIFSANTSYTTEAAYWNAAFASSDSTLLTQPGQFGIEMIGTGNPFFALEKNVAPLKIGSPFDISMSLLLTVKDVTDITSSMVAPQLRVSLPGRFSSPNKYVDILWLDKSINISFIDPDGFLMDYTLAGNQFGLVLRFCRMSDGYYNIGFTHLNKFYKLNRKPFRFIAGADSTFITCLFSGENTLTGNGSLSIYNITSWPMLSSDSWVDDSVTGLPLCISKTSEKMVFDSYPMSFGKIVTGQIMGYLNNTDFDTAIIPVPELELVYDLFPKDNPSLMVSPLEKIYSDSESFACPVEAEKLNESDTTVFNRCFNDGAASDTDPIILSTKRVGTTQNNVNQTELYIKSDGNTYGRDLDLRKIHVLDEKATLSDLPRLEVIELAITEEVSTNVSRCLTLSNDRRVYYGTSEPLSDINNGEQTTLRIKFRLTPKYLQSEQATIPNQIIDGVNLSFKIVGMEDTVTVDSMAGLVPDTAYELRYEIPKGHYYIEFRRVPDNLLYDSSLVGFSGTISVELLDPRNDEFVTVALYSSLGDSKLSFGESLKLRFDNRVTFGYGWFSVYDPATSSMIRNTQTEPEDLFECATQTDSISCVEMPDGFALIFLSNRLASYANAIVDPYLIGLEGDLNYIRYNYDGTETSRGLISVDNLSGECLHAFDAYSDNDNIYILYSIRSNAVTRRSNVSYTVGQNTYFHQRINSSPFPFIHPEIYVKRMSFGTHSFELDETAGDSVGQFPLTSLNNLKSTYRVDGGGNAKGQLPNSETFSPNHTTGAATIRVNYDRILDLAALAVIDNGFRLPLVFSGKRAAYREVAVPPFFKLHRHEKTENPPIRSLDAAYGIDGYIWTVASTLTFRAQLGSQPFDTFTTGKKLSNRFEIMPLSTEILASNRFSFFNRSVETDWYDWRFIDAYVPLKSFQPMGILNQADDFIMFQYRGAALNPSATSEGLMLDIDLVEVPRSRRSECISISSDKQMLVVGQSGSLSGPPSFFHMYHADRLGFNVPCDRHYDVNSVNLNTFLPGKLNLFNTTFASAVKLNHIHLNFNTSSALVYGINRTQDTANNRYSNLDVGSRTKAVFTVDQLNAVPISFTVSDSAFDPSDVTAIPDISIGICRVDLSIVAGELLIESFTATKFGSTTIELTSKCFELDILMMKSGSLTFDISVILRELDQTWNSFHNPTATSYIAGNAPYEKQDDYYRNYSKRVWKHDKNNALLGFSAGDPAYSFSIAASAGTPDSFMNVLYCQFGTVSHDGLLEGFSSFGNFSQTPNRRSYQPGDDPIPSDVGFTDFRIDRSKSGFPVYTKSSSKEIYATNGFSARTSSAYIEQNRFTLERAKINAANSLRAKQIQGRWISTEDNATVYVWADARDSKKEKLLFNHVAIAGANFSQFFVVVKDDFAAPWKRVHYVDTRLQSYTGLNSSSYSNVSSGVATTNNDTARRGFSIDQVNQTEAERSLDFIVKAIGIPGLVPVIEYYPGQVLTSSDTIIPKIATQRQRARSESVNRSYSIAKLQKGRIVIHRDQVPANHISIYNEDWHEEIEQTSARYIGIEIIPQETVEGYYTANVIDLGVSSRIGIKFASSDGSGTSSDYNLNKSYLIDNSAFNTDFKLIDRSYVLEYNASDISDFTKLKSMVERVALSNMPIWVFETDPTVGMLTLCSDSPQYKILLDDKETKIYSIKVEFKAVR